VPIFVASHRPPGPSVANYPLVTYVTDGIASAMAGEGRRRDRNVVVHGASRVELDIARVTDTPEATHIRNRVRR
jgi:hypothetical protein